MCFIFFFFLFFFSNTLHGLVDEFDHDQTGYVSFDNFVAVIKRDEDHNRYHERHSDQLQYDNRRRRPQPSQRTLREARSIVAKFQSHFHTRTSSIDQLHEVFDAFDRYGDGHIAGKDFVVAMQHLDFSRSHDALLTVVDMLDPDHTGYIAWHTFFDHLALEASSGLTPRCLTIDTHGSPNASPSRKNGRRSTLHFSGGLSPRHHGRSSVMSPERQSRLKIKIPEEYPKPEGKSEGKPYQSDDDDDYEDIMNEAHLLLQVLEGYLVNEARKIATKKRMEEEEEDRFNGLNQNKRKKKKKKKRNKKNKKNRQVREVNDNTNETNETKDSTNINTSNTNQHESSSSKIEHEIKTEEKYNDSNNDTDEDKSNDEYEGKQSVALILNLTPVELLSYLVSEFDSLDYNASGAVNYKILFKYLKRLKLTEPVPKISTMWGCVRAINSELDGTIQLYDWLSTIGTTALDPLSDEMLSRIRTIYRQNLTDSTGQHAFREMLVIPKQNGDISNGQGGQGGQGTTTNVVTFDKYLSLIATLPRQPLSSVVARYLWDHLSGSDQKTEMTWTEFLVEMMEKDDRAKLNATLRGMGAKGLGMSMAEKAAKSPRSKATGSNDADVLKEEVDHIWNGLQMLFHVDQTETQTRWEKMDAVRRQFFSLRNDGRITRDEEHSESEQGLDHRQFVSLLRCMELSTNVAALRHVTLEFDLDDSHSINWMEFVAGILERPPSREIAAEGTSSIQKFNSETRKKGRKILKRISLYFQNMDSDEQVEKISEMYQLAKIEDSKDSHWKIESKGLDNNQFNLMLSKILKKLKNSAALLNPMTGLLHEKVLKYLSYLFDEDKDGDISSEEFISCLLTQSKFNDSVGVIRATQRRHELEEDSKKRRLEKEEKDIRLQILEEKRLRDLKENNEHRSSEVEEGSEVEGASMKKKRSKRQGRTRNPNEHLDFEDDSQDDTDSEEDEDDAFMSAANELKNGLGGDENLPPGFLPELPVTDSEEEDDDDENDMYREKPEERKERKKEEKLKWMLKVNDQNLIIMNEMKDNNLQHLNNLKKTYLLYEKKNKSTEDNDWNHLNRVPDVQTLVANETNIGVVHEKMIVEGAFMNVGIHRPFRSIKTKGKQAKNHSKNQANVEDIEKYENERRMRLRKKRRAKLLKQGKTILKDTQQNGQYVTTSKLIAKKYDEIPQRSRKEWSKVLTIWERHLEDIELRVTHAKNKVEITQNYTGGVGNNRTNGLMNSITGIDVSHLEQTRIKRTMTAKIQQEKIEMYSIISTLENEILKYKREIYRESDYWFERDSSRINSIRLRFVRNLTKPPQIVYESLLSISSRFRTVNTILKEMKLKFDLESSMVVDDRTGGNKPTPPLSDMNASTSSSPKRKRYVTRKETKDLMERIKEKENRLKLDRTKYLDLALATHGQGYSWPPQSIIPTNEIKTLRLRYIQYGMDNAVRSAVKHSKDPTHSRNPFETSNAKFLDVGVHETNETNETNTTETTTDTTASQQEAKDVAFAIVLALNTAERHYNQKLIAKMTLKNRTSEIETALEMIGLEKNQIVMSTAAYNNYIIRITKGSTQEIWLDTISNIIQSIEKKELSRIKTLKRVFNAIDFKNKGFINGRAVLKFAMGTGPSRIWIPKVVLSLMQGKKYRKTLMNMTKVADTNNDGVVDENEFVGWALPRWTPTLPSLELAQSAVAARTKDAVKIDLS